MAVVGVPDLRRQNQRKYASAIATHTSTAQTNSVIDASAGNSLTNARIIFLLRG